MEGEIINKISESGLIQLNLEDFLPKVEKVLLDIKPWLFEEQILKEKDFREKIRNHEWSGYSGKAVAITCSADAIIPTWAFMLVAVQLEPFAEQVVFGGLAKLNEQVILDSISKINPLDFKDQRVVIKGCSTDEMPVSAYVELTSMLRPVVKSLMFGEPCSTVPLYKRKESEK